MMTALHHSLLAVLKPEVSRNMYTCCFHCQKFSAILPDKMFNVGSVLQLMATIFLSLTMLKKQLCFAFYSYLKSFNKHDFTFLWPSTTSIFVKLQPLSFTVYREDGSSVHVYIMSLTSGTHPSLHIGPACVC